MKEDISISHLYQIIFPNGKKYIGITNNPKRRWESHKASARRADRIFPVYTAMRKYGIENCQFQIIVTGTREYILDLEQKAIVLYKTLDHSFGYNIARGGQTSPVEGKGHSEVSRKKMSKSQKLRIRTEEENDRLRKAAVGRICSEQHRQRLSDAGKRRWSKPEEIEKAKNNFSPERLQKLSEITTARNLARGGHSEETKRKISEAARKHHADPEYKLKHKIAIEKRSSNENWRATCGRRKGQ